MGVEKLVDKVSIPTALTSAPLGNLPGIHIADPSNALLEQSYYMVGKEEDPSHYLKPMDEYRVENDELKRAIDLLTKRLHSLEHVNFFIFIIIRQPKKIMY
jgi:hypothetical protein